MAHFAGVVSGHLLWGLASAIGVAAVLNASATLYTICGSLAQHTSYGWAYRHSSLAVLSTKKRQHPWRQTKSAHIGRG